MTINTSLSVNENEIQRILDKLQSPTVFDRVKATEEIAGRRIRDERIVQLLMHVKQSDEEQNVRVAAEKALYTLASKADLNMSSSNLSHNTKKISSKEANNMDEHQAELERKREERVEVAQSKSVSNITPMGNDTLRPVVFAGIEGKHWLGLILLAACLLALFFHLPRAGKPNVVGSWVTNYENEPTLTLGFFGEYEWSDERSKGRWDWETRGNGEVLCLSPKNSSGSTCGYIILDDTGTTMRFEGGRVWFRAERQ